MKRHPFLLILILVLATGAWFWWSKANKNGTGPAFPGGAPQTVSVLTVKMQPVSLTEELPGRISPYRQSQVRPQVDGIITERLFSEGTDVKKGQQLYQIDDARYKAALNSALADLKSAQASVKSVKAREERYKDLVNAGAVSKQEYDDVKAELDQANAAIAVAQAAVDVATVNLGYTKVYAPIDGRISRSFVTEGTLVTANQTQYLATITQLNPVYIDMQQSGVEAMALRSRMIGMETIPVRLILGEQTKTEYPQEGVLKFSEVTIDETAGSIALRALMPNPDGLLLPGLFVRASLDLGQKESLLIPQRATVRMPDGSLTAWIVDGDNKAQPRPVQTEQSYKDNWIVSGGLKAGEQIIVEGYQKIAPGTTVTPVPWEKQNENKPKNTDGKR